MHHSAAFLPILGAVLLFVAVLAVIPAIFYLLTLQRAIEKCSPASRAIQPAMVWLCLIPLFGIVWNFIMVLNIAKTLRSEFNLRGIPCPEAEPAQSIGLGMCICPLLSFIPIVGFLAALAGLVLWIMYWLKINEYSRLLDLPVAAPSLPTAF